MPSIVVRLSVLISASGTRRSPRGWPLLVRADLVLVASTMVMAVLGAVMVYSATRDNTALGVSPHYYLDRQALFVAIGVVVMVVLALMDYHWLEHASIVLYGGLVLGLLGVRLVGHTSNGAARWIKIGPLELQPSAFAALILTVVVATYCSHRAEGLEPRDVLKMLALWAGPIILVVKEPDLGSAIVMAVTLFVMLVVAGVPNRYLVLLVLLVVLGFIGIAHFGLLQRYQTDRLTGFLHHNGAQSYNVAQSQAAIGDGGFGGRGLFKGAQTNLSYVPEQQTDFIFSAVGEQLGFVGTASVLFLMGMVMFRILRAAQTARDPLGRMLATGAFTLIGFSVFENAGMAMGVLPATGIPFPFLSYGGSATIAFFAAVGVALSVRLRRVR